jgi:hypothetical protein
MPGGAPALERKLTLIEVSVIESVVIIVLVPRLASERTTDWMPTY